MSTRVIGLIQLQDSNAFERYRQQVGATVEAYGGSIRFRGRFLESYWNELNCAPFDALVELEFPDAESARRWRDSPDYQALLAIRSQAMKLSLFAVE